MAGRKPSSLPAFKAWLVARGAIIDPPTSSWEILRCRTSLGTHVVYQNKAGKETWPEDLRDIRDKFDAGIDVPLSPDLRNRVRLRHLVEALASRDGLWCWFCETGFLTSDSGEITIEHLVPKAHGGPDHASNLVLACGSCNGEAGNKSVAEKVALRDLKRGFVCDQPTEARANG